MPFTATTLKRADKDEEVENDENMKTTDLPRIHFDFVYSLSGGNRNDVVTNCAVPQLRSVQLPGNVMPVYAWANAYSPYCVWLCMTVYVYWRVHHSGYHSHPVKYNKDIPGCTYVHTTNMVSMRARACMCIIIRTHTGWDHVWFPHRRLLQCLLHFLQTVFIAFLQYISHRKFVQVAHLRFAENTFHCDTL